MTDHIALGKVTFCECLIRDLSEKISPYSENKNLHIVWGSCGVT